MLLSMRESWADVCNGLLPEGVRIDHRSLEEQGIDRVPTIHEGYASREMEKRGQPSDRMAINREIGASNRDLAEGDAAVDALRAHQSELRRLLRDMAERNARTKRLVETGAIVEKARGGAYDDEGRQTFSDGLNGIISVYDPSRGGNVDMRVIDVIDRRIPRLPRSETTTGTAAAASRTVQATAPQPAHAQPQSFTPNPQRIEHRTGAQQPDRWA